jgi:hypothetical protein
MARSQSIPIVRDPKIMQEEADQESNFMMADYQDYIFYVRLLNGIEERQKEIKHADLRYQNEALINKIKCTRHCDIREQKANHNYIACDTARAEGYLYKTLEWSNRANSEDEMMFEMDM